MRLVNATYQKHDGTKAYNITGGSGTGGRVRRKLDSLQPRLGGCDFCDAIVPDLWGTEQEHDRMQHAMMHSATMPTKC